jgi:hypothetical protein
MIECRSVQRTGRSGCFSACEEIKSTASKKPELVALASDLKTIQPAKSNMSPEEPSFPDEFFVPNASKADVSLIIHERAKEMNAPVR